MQRATATDLLGTTELWSSDRLYQHLNILQKFVPKANEAAARTWIDAFFFRAAAMSPPGKKLVLNLEQSVPGTGIPSNFPTAGGFIDYTAVTASEIDAKRFLNNPKFEKLIRYDHALFVSEAKARDMPLENHIPQAVCEMYACAKKLQKNMIRGAVTNGRDWIFIFLKMNTDGNGGMYAPSQRIHVISGAVEGDIIDKSRCSLIAGIITHWINRSNDDIGDDDWFTVDWEQ